MKILHVCIGSQGTACTEFQINHSGDVFVGKNFDWIVGDGLLFVNKRGMSKKAIPTFIDKKNSSDQFVDWVSKYGSVTYNPFGREFGFGGMNEVGLVIGSLAFSGTKTPKPDARPSISALQFVQYLLDNYGSVKEVIESEKSIRIRPLIKQAGHIFAADKDGNSAVIEFINGKQVCYTNDSMPYKALTNSAYQKSIECYEKNKIPRRDEANSIERFINTVNMLREYDTDSKVSPLDYSFQVLEKASFQEKKSIGKLNIIMETKWSFVYDLNRLQIYFRTNNNQNIRIINLKSFDFSCSTPVKVLDINTQLSGDVTEAFTEYTPQINNTLVKIVFKKTPYPVWYGFDIKSIFHFVKSGFREFPEYSAENIEALLTYPDTTVCTKQLR